MTTPTATPFELREDLLDAVQRVRPLAEAHACASQDARTLEPTVVRALRDVGLFGLTVPAELGGHDAHGLIQLDVFEAMAHADTSAGWALMIGATLNGMLGAYLPAAEELFAGVQPITAGLQVPLGMATPAAGGYRVSGRWGFGSGVRHADWVLTPAVVAEAVDGAPTFVQVAVPRARVVVEDTWDTSLLRGSGSEHYRMEDVFVAHEYTCTFPAPARLRGGPTLQLPFVALTAPGHMGFALGTARRALEEAASGASRRTLPWAGELLGSQSSFRVALGRHEVALAAAAALAREALGEAITRVAHGDALAPTHWARLRAAVTYVTEVALEVTTFGFRALGGSALSASAPVERAMRDMLAGTQHIAATVENYEYAGRVRLGERPEHPMLAPRPPA